MERNELVWFLIPVVMLLISAVMWWFGEAQEKAETLAMTLESEVAPAVGRRDVATPADDEAS
jgi:cytochrome c-type biogenesis protein CcmH/NrfF